MLSWLPSLPYPPPDQPGFWNPVTSTINWCEEDYYATYYSAEIVNTLTNVMFIWLAYEGVKSCHRNGHDTVFSVAYFGYFLVGAGSFMFHTTLKYPWQLVDELNMIYTTCLMVYASLSYARSAAVRMTLAVFLVAMCTFITLYYHYLQDPTFHQTVYAVLTLFIVLRSIYTMEYSLRPSLRKSTEKDRERREHYCLPVPTRDEQRYLNARDMAILKNMWILVAYGVSIFLGGFAFWSIDNVYCIALRRWRRDIGLPWGILLEGHGWWHLMTGVGAYCYIVWGIWLRHVLNGSQEEYELVWPRLYRLPEIVLVSPSRQRGANAAGNGVTVNGNTEAVGNGVAANGDTKKSK